MEEKKDPEYYEQFVIKKYKYWTLLVNEYQTYLGKAVAWLEREGDMQRLSSITKEEREEFWNVVLPEYENALEKSFKPDHMNYAWLGNWFHMHKGHGHMHLIPRYASPREFAGRTFVDEKWGSHYIPTNDQSLSIELAHAVRDAFREHIR